MQKTRHKKAGPAVGLLPNSVVRAYYSRVAEPYDRTFAKVVDPTNRRLTEELGIHPQDRILDLACGTGISTLRMAQISRNGEIVGVDDSREMLARAKGRFREAGRAGHFVCAPIDQFLMDAPRNSFDIITLRFAMTYLDWRVVLPQLPALLRPGGRIGIVTSLSDSLGQLQVLQRTFVRSPELAVRLFDYTNLSFRRSFFILRQLRTHFVRAPFIQVPSSTADILEPLAGLDVIPVVEWTEKRREWHASGTELVDWVVQAGCVAQSALNDLAPDAFEFLRALFTRGLHRFREEDGFPLDFRFAGVVLKRRVP